MLLFNHNNYINISYVAYIIGDYMEDTEFRKKPDEKGFEYLSRIVGYLKNSGLKTEMYGETLR